MTEAVQHTFRTGHRGLTLIEAAMVLGIATLVVIGAMAFFSAANGTAKITEIVGELTAVQQAVRSVYAGQPDYADLAPMALARSLPADMVSGSGSNTRLQHAFGGAIGISPVMVGGATHYNGFALRLNGLPTEACVKVASVDFGGGLSSMDVFSGTAFVLGLTKPMTPAAAGTFCSNSNSSTIVWRFY